MRKEMSVICRLMWERRLTNAAGGNFAVRVDENRILISPSMMAEHRHCMLGPEDFMLIDYDENILEGTGKLSREG
jgi:L-fuculose-phosphate aldolase